MLTPMKDSASGNIIVAVDETEKRVLLSKDGGKTPFYELAVFGWDEDERRLEDIRDGVERILHQKDGGIWHLGDEPLEPADIDMSRVAVENLPFQRPAFAMWDHKKRELIVLLLTQSKLGVFSAQAYVAEHDTSAIDGVVLKKRGTPAVVTEVEGEEERRFLVNLGPDDVCHVRYLPGMNPNGGVYYHRGRHRGDTSVFGLVVLDPRPAFFTWRFEGEGDTAIVLTKRR